MGPTWGPPGADKTQVGPKLAPWTLLSGIARLAYGLFCRYNEFLFRYKEKVIDFFFFFGGGGGGGGGGVGGWGGGYNRFYFVITSF